MPRITHTPTDQTASSSASCGSSSCSQDNIDVALGTGIPARPGSALRLFITSETSSDCEDTVGSLCSGQGTIWYSVNGGSTWIEIVAQRSNCVCVAFGSCSNSAISVETEIVLGDAADMSQIQVRTRAKAVTNDNNNNGGSSANITAWRLTAQTVVGIIGGE